ncbi:MAG: PDZ domain-containing protein [Clostridia bacterium]|nr:PDZ domain-containing protein [Clostridia bacterium]
MKNLKFMISIFVLTFFYMYVANITQIPKDIVLLDKEKLDIKLLPYIEKIETVKTSNENANNKNIELKLFGKVHLKDINVNVLENIEVIPIGKVIGLKLYTNGVLIVGLSEIENSKPYNEEEIKEGDTIIKIDDKYIETIEDLKEAVNNSKGNNLNLTLNRNGSIFTSNIKPVKNKEDEYKLGLWVKDAATGVGTISFYEPNSKSFAALGHGITDNDTDSLIDIESGELVTSKVISIKKGEKGVPRRNKRNYYKSTDNRKCREKY